MQINRTGYFLLAFFFIGGLIFTVVEFTVFPFPIFLGPIWIVTSVGLGVYAIRQARKGRHELWLHRNRVFAAGGPLVSASSGALINDQPLMTLELDLEVPGQAPRRVTPQADHLQLRRPPDAARAHASGLRQSPRPRRPSRRLVSQTLDKARSREMVDLVGNAGAGGILALAVTHTGKTPEREMHI